MAFFNAISSAYEKAQSSIIVQDVLKHVAERGLFDGNIVSTANKLIANAWALRPTLFNGTDGPKPHKASIAAFALAIAVASAKECNEESNYYTFTLALGLIMQELKADAHTYPFHRVDRHLLDHASNTLHSEIIAFADSEEKIFLDQILGAVQ